MLFAFFFAHSIVAQKVHVTAEQKPAEPFTTAIIFDVKRLM